MINVKDYFFWWNEIKWEGVYFYFLNHILQEITCWLVIIIRIVIDVEDVCSLLISPSVHPYIKNIMTFIFSLLTWLAIKLGQTFFFGIIYYFIGNFPFINSWDVLSGIIWRRDDEDDLLDDDIKKTGIVCFLPMKVWRNTQI